MLRISQIEEYGAAALKGVGQQEAAVGHFEFGVMRRAGGTRDGDGGYDLGVMRRVGVGIEDREEVGVLLSVVSGPDEEVGGRRKKSRFLAGLGMTILCDSRRDSHAASRVTSCYMSGDDCLRVRSGSRKPFIRE
jgi:hypothetical protein